MRLLISHVVLCMLTLQLASTLVLAAVAAEATTQGRNLLSSPTRPNCPCPRIYRPVCGIDGRAYPNKCVAQCAGIQITDPSPPNPQACSRIQVLPPGPNSRPGGSSTGRRLQQRGPPAVCRCPKIYLPVCGSDGKAYDNKCLAQCAGVSINGQRPVNGVCNSGPEGPVNPSGPGFNPSGPGGIRPWTLPGTSNPNAGDIPPPNRGPVCACPAILAPVCGVDCKTYDNKCIAECRGVAIASQGRCQ